jgi:LmbE family N-acetylglucosaminyl deacetylase
VNAPQVVILSPHLDDAVLSVGALIARLAAEGSQVEVWTLFSSGPQFGQIAADRRAFSNYATRRAEDERALARLGAGHRWFDLRERIWRDPPISKVLHLFRTPDSDAAFTNLESIEEVIVALLARPEVQIYAPLGVGNHYDHVEVALSAIRALIERAAFDRLLFYEDFYALGAGCRRRHFVARQRGWRSPLAAPTWASPALGALLVFTAWSARGPGIDSYLPAARSLKWSCRPEPVVGFESAKLEALAEYRSQGDAIGGMRRLTPFIRRAHASQGGELIWRAAP